MSRPFFRARFCSPGMAVAELPSTRNRDFNCCYFKTHATSMHCSSRALKPSQPQAKRPSRHCAKIIISPRFLVLIFHFYFSLCLCFPRLTPESSTASEPKLFSTNTCCGVRNPSKPVSRRRPFFFCFFANTSFVRISGFCGSCYPGRYNVFVRSAEFCH